MVRLMLDEGLHRRQFERDWRVTRWLVSLPRYEDTLHASGLSLCVTSQCNAMKGGRSRTNPRRVR
jgi:hypothetical protein